jgi:two-component system sensor histidine kinase BaeS
MRSLTFKLSLAFLLVSLAGVALVALAVWSFNSMEFSRLLLDRAENSFVAAAVAYYEAQGNWDGVTQALREQGLISPERVPGQNPAPQSTPVPGGPGGGQPFPPPPFVLADQAGKVVVEGGPYHVGDTVPSAQLAGGKPVTVNGQVVGTVLTTGTAPPRNPSEERYLARTNQALLIAALGATVLALLLGILLARTITRPVRELTAASHAMARGQLKQQVPVRSKDELGELTLTFNQMSSDLANANLLRRQMTADIAHDLRNPLMVITGYLESLRDGTLPPSPERFDTIYREAQLLQRLVDDLRTLSLADAGELTLNRTPLAPRALLERLVAAYRQRAEQNQITLSVQAEPALPEVEADEERMAQVLGNLVTNALRYTPPGGQIILGAVAQPKALQLTVQDNGSGISPEALPHIFDRFFRGDAARAEADGESGLGLAIAKSLVEAHQGTIAAASEPGRGTTFFVTLPALRKS